jgi:hypothetical protein
MKVFISWSGPRSRAVASALRDLIPDALQNVETWMSDHEIAAGTRWSAELGGALEGSRSGIICLTPENLQAPWLLFEAGSLARSVASSRVVPYLLDLSPTDVEFPLAQFQRASADRAGTSRLLAALNNALEIPLPTERISRIFERWWPELEARLAAVPPAGAVKTIRRGDRELLEEILELVRREKAPAPEPARHSPDVAKSLRDSSEEYLRSQSAALRSSWSGATNPIEVQYLEGRISQIEAELLRREEQQKADTEWAG